MTYTLWTAAIRSAVFPEGEAENLVANHNRYIQDALIDLQNKIPCLQGFHRDNITSELSYFDCGASVFTAPVGFIKSVHTILDTDCCARVWYSPATESDMQCKMAAQEKCGVQYRAYGSYLYDGSYIPYAYHYECQIYPDAALDKPCRAAGGIVAMIRGQLYVHPHLQSNETLVIEWDGMKKLWISTEEIDFGTFQRQVSNAVELYLERAVARKETSDKEAAASAKDDYDVAVAMMIHECDKLRTLAPRAFCFNNCAC